MAPQVEVDGVFFETMIAEIKKNCLLGDYLLVNKKQNMYNYHFQICSKVQECHVQRLTNRNELHDMFFLKKLNKQQENNVPENIRI